jgi:serine/threonine-protein kinase
VAQLNATPVDTYEDPVGVVGEIIRRRYRLDRFIGVGGTGSVWRGSQLEAGIPVAIKLLGREHLRSRVVRARFAQEVEAVSRFRSRFVVRFFEHGETSGGIPYSVMELLSGETLEQRLLRYGRLPLEEVVRFTLQVARGLSLAHSHGVVHRDVKPSNIFLHESEEPDLGRIAKLIDFGVAKVENRADRSWVTLSGHVLGTPAYMSPEQALGQPSVDARSDLFSLGMVVFHLLTGVTPYEGDGYGQLLLAVCTQPLPRLLERAPGLPPALEAWFQRACAREPDARFQKAQDFARELLLASGFKEPLDGVLGRGSPPPHPIDLLRMRQEEPPTLLRLERPSELPSRP